MIRVVPAVAGQPYLSVDYCLTLAKIAIGQGDYVTAADWLLRADQAKRVAS